MNKTDRAAILPLPGDPFLFNLWLKFYDKYWGQAINTLYVHLNAPVEEAVVKYISKLCESRNIFLMYTPNYTDHGNAINQLLDVVTEKYVMLIEDDAFIWNADVVDAAFALLESGNFDIVGSKRGSCATEILEAANQKWDIPTSGLGDQGPNFWPCYFFSSVELLKKTDRNFNARAWYRGETIEPLGCEVDVDVVYGDTFVNTSLQLRAIVPPHRIAYLPQYHSHPDDMRHADKSEFLFDGQAPWCHIGSLSSGMSGLLKDNNNRPLANRSHLDPENETVLQNAPNTEMEKMEYERRVQIWLTAWKVAAEDPLLPITKHGIIEFLNEYHDSIQRVIRDFGLSKENILKRMRVYQDRLFKL